MDQTVTKKPNAPVVIVPVICVVCGLLKSEHTADEINSGCKR